MSEITAAISPSSVLAKANPATVSPTGDLAAVNPSPVKPVARTNSVLRYQDIVFKEQIGEGAFGEIWRGSLWSFEVAVKTLKRVKESDFVAFKQEAEILSKLRHPNIVTFLGACFEKPNVCIVTEFLKQGNLADYIEKKTLNSNKKLSLFAVLNIAMDVALGLNWLHHSGVIHRDLKPHNLLVDRYNTVKIADFGLSHLKAQVQYDSTGNYEMLGTPCYMAPEVLKKMPYGHKCDVFSFAMVLCELVTGSYPWSHTGAKMNSKDHEQAIIQGMRPPIPKDTHPELVNLIKACWKDDPAKRPSPEEIVGSLDSIRMQLQCVPRSLDDLMCDLPDVVMKAFDVKVKELEVKLAFEREQTASANRKLQQLKKKISSLDVTLSNSPSAPSTPSTKLNGGKKGRNGRMLFIDMDDNIISGPNTPAPATPGTHTRAGSKGRSESVASSISNVSMASLHSASSVSSVVTTVSVAPSSPSPVTISPSPPLPVNTNHCATAAEASALSLAAANAAHAKVTSSAALAAAAAIRAAGLIAAESPTKPKNKKGKNKGKGKNKHGLTFDMKNLNVTEELEATIGPTDLVIDTDSPVSARSVEPNSANLGLSPSPSPASVQPILSAASALTSPVSTNVPANSAAVPTPVSTLATVPAPVAKRGISITVPATIVTSPPPDISDPKDFPVVAPASTTHLSGGTPKLVPVVWPSPQLGARAPHGTQAPQLPALSLNSTALVVETHNGVSLAGFVSGPVIASGPSDEKTASTGSSFEKSKKSPEANIPSDDWQDWNGSKRHKRKPGPGRN